MTTLGERLAENIAREKQAAIDVEAAFSLQATQEAREKFQTIQNFFLESREFFTQSILTGKSVDKLFQQVGGSRYSSVGNCHHAVGVAMDIYDFLKDQPASMYDPKRYASLWHEFRQWAQNEGLIAAWHRCSDGGGMEEWWQLRVSVIPQVLNR